MCGIIGMAGKSTDPETSFKLATELIRHSQRRGKAACGHYAVAADGQVDFFKVGVEPVDYVKMEQWGRVEALNPIVAIMHDRFASKGAASDNSNNHPFVTQTGNLAIVHNGQLHRYDELKAEFKLESDCDSELILKIIAKTGNVVEGIKRVFAMFGSTGDFTCEVAYRNPKTNKTRLFFFRDAGRPGRFIDATKELGQVFFFSQNDIWKDAIAAAGLDELLGKLKIKMVPAYQIWVIEPNEDSGVKITKIKVATPVRKKIRQKIRIFGDTEHMDTIDRAFWTGNAFDDKNARGSVDQTWFDGPKN